MSNSKKSEEKLGVLFSDRLRTEWCLFVEKHSIHF